MEYNTVVLKKYNQLINIIPAQPTVYNGITITKNSDGTITASGTATSTLYFQVQDTSGFNATTIGNKYLLIGCPIGGSTQTYCIVYNTNGFAETGNGAIMERNSGGVYYDRAIILQIKSGQTVNLVFKPKLVDLTEIYGAGNEPTAVDQFLTDYPEFNGYVECSLGKRQLVANGDFNGTANWAIQTGYVSFETSNNIATITSTNSTSADYFYRLRNVNVVHVKANHKFYIGVEVNPSFSDRFLAALDRSGGQRIVEAYSSGNLPANQWSKVNGILSNSTWTELTFEVCPKNVMAVGNSYQVKNFVVADLTELYGSGNEPATVETFLQKCPQYNNYIPYEEAFLERQYDTLVGKISKNLFDISKVRSSNALINNMDGTVTVRAGNSLGQSAGGLPKIKDYCPNLKVGDTAVLNFNSVGQPFIFLNGAGQLWTKNTSKIITEEILNSDPLFYNTAAPFENDVIISNFQLELGSTATDYEPYGWIEKEYNALTLKKYNQLFNHPLNGTYFTETVGSIYKDLLFVTGFISEATHKYFLAMPNNDNLYTAVDIGGYREMSTTSAVSPTKLITEAQAGHTNNYVYVRVKSAKSITNTQVWFSIVDLTQMYGAGNEPTTVQKFLEDNPQYNDYVPYSEGGWM